MKRLFLASAAYHVMPDIARRIDKKGLRLVFINTASETEKGEKLWLKADRKSLVDFGFLVTDYTITNKTREEIRKELDKHDVIFMSGGNTFFLLEQMQKSNSKEVFIDLVENGKIYIGSSAGSIITGPDISPLYSVDRIEQAPNLKGFKGLGLVNFVTFPHWGRQDFNKIYTKHRLKHAYTEKNNIIILTDDSYVEVRDDWYRVVKV